MGVIDFARHQASAAEVSYIIDINQENPVEAIAVKQMRPDRYSAVVMMREFNLDAIDHCRTQARDMIVECMRRGVDTMSQDLQA